MVIDAHVHLIKPFDSQGKRQVYTSNPASAQDYVALMDEAGVDRAFFISWSPQDIPADLLRKGIAPQSVRQTMSREYALDVLARFPERFYWFPCHLAPDIADHLALARANLELGAAGLKLAPSYWGELPDDDRLIPFYELAREFGAQIIVDTSYWYLGKERGDDPDTLPVGFRETARRVTDFRDYLRHLRPIIEACPTVNFSLAHAGARDSTLEHAGEVGAFIREHPNVFADLAALPLAGPGLELLVETAGENRVMFGTDWPHFGQAAAMRELMHEIARPGRFTSETARMILGENALSFVNHRAPGLNP